VWTRTDEARDDPLGVQAEATGEPMTSRTMRMRALAFGGAVVVSIAVAANAQVTRPIPGDPVTTEAGFVTGTLDPSGLRTYLGIPFAAPPVRENRWRGPQPVKPWDGVLTANRRPTECVQGLRSSNANHYFGDEVAGEDCLYLNIWAPGTSNARSKLPVVVYIYGGAFNVGSASSPVYAGDALAKKGLIYVTLNYRLGIFGFLAHPDLTKESGHHASGNWGFLDQVAALQWVKRNIAAFGGDPGNVTLVGQSAGAMSINNLQASPLAKGLFARVFGMSGATVKGGPADASGTSLKDAEAQGVKLQEAMNAKTLADMRHLSSDRVTAIAQKAGVRPGPDIDGYYLPDSVDSIFRAGKQNDVTVVTGSTANDIGTTPAIRQARDLEQYKQLAAQMYGDKAGEFLTLWPASDDAAAVKQADEVGRNSGFGAAARSLARLQTLTGKQPAYLFMWSRVQPFTPGVMFGDFDPGTAGAYHMGDLPYILGTYEAFNLFRRTRDWTAYDRELSEKVQNVLVAYARTGVPGTLEVTLVKYDPKNEQRVDFGDTITVEKLNGRGMDFLLDTPATRPPRGPGRGGAGGAVGR
jgi:para-nitrobenzyl esterase